MSRKGKGRAAAGRHQQEASFDRRDFARRFVRNVLLWLLPVALGWLLLTPFYNQFLTRATENLVRLTENPSVTRLAVAQKHYFVITRSDYTTRDGRHLASVRVTDTHFPLIMLGAFFLAVPGTSWRRRLEPLGWSLLISAFFHIVSLFFWVKFTYATQLGAWSAANYSTWGQNFWGLSKHLLDLPFKFALPFILWSAFYVRRLLPERSA